MDRKSESKSNLNESTLPLLEDEANKEKIELEPKAKTESSEEKATEAAQEDAVDAAKKKKEEEKERKRALKQAEEDKKKAQKAEKQKQKEEEKEKKLKEKADKAEQKKAAQEAAKANGTGASSGNGGNNACRNWTAYTSPFTAGINLLDRDEHGVNGHVNVNFEDIIGEPDAAQGWDGPYSTAFGTFQFVRFWLYRILMVILSVPFALLWAVVFALLSLLSVWILTPAFRVLDILLYFVHRLWNAWVRTFLDPIFTSISLVLQRGTTPVNQTPSASFSGKPVVCGGKYNQLSTSETVASYTKTEDGDQVALNMQNN